MTFLDRIVTKKIDRLGDIRTASKTLGKRTRPLHSLKERIHENPNLSVIAEIKRGSPSLGLFAPDLDVKSVGSNYQTCGAAAVSILTDEHFFGSYEDIEAVSPLLDLPILAKDFILDPAQVALAYSAGADVILLIAAILTPEKVSLLADTAFAMGMEVLLELHSADELTMDTVPAGMILGLNNRNLKTFQVSIDNGIREIQHLKKRDVCIIAESGIHTVQQAHSLRNAGFSGMLIGESLIRDRVSGTLLRELTVIPKEMKP